MKPIAKPMIDQPIEESLRRVYGAGVSADLPPDLAAALSRFAAHAPAARSNDGRSSAQS